MANLSGDFVWIGFTDEENEGDWRWITGEIVTYTNWDYMEPNDAENGEDYVEMYGDGSWNDNGAPNNPSLELYYVCEWEDNSPPQNVIFGGVILIGIGMLFFGQKWYRIRMIKRR